MRFADVTTIHGLFYISKGFRWKQSVRFIWIFIVLASFGCCVWQSTLNIKDYRMYNVSISTSFEYREQQMYPAITFWNENGMKRTVIGRNSAIMIAATIYGGDNDGIKQVFRQLNKTCLYKPKILDIIDQKLAKFNIADLRYQSYDFIFTLIDFITMSRAGSFVKCWWNKKEIDCEKLVLTTMTDQNIAFSINLHTNVAKNFFGNESGLSMFNGNFDKGMTQMASSSKVQQIQLLMNVNADEYCAYMKEIWYGVGFNMKFHDPLTMPSAQLGTSILLHPGYQYNIALKPVQRIRNTEHMGKCISSYWLYMFPETANYSQELCHLQYENELLWKVCGCLATYLKTAARAFAKYHNLNDTETKRICVASDRQCTMDLLDNITRSRSLETYFPQCNQPCRETEYNYDITATTFPPKKFNLYYTKVLNLSDIEVIRKSFFLLNIFFDSTSVNVVVESQWFTLKDLFVYLGNNIGLFLGMSFMSFGEIVHLLFQFISFLFKMLRKKAQMRRNRKIRVRTVIVRGRS